MKKPAVAYGVLVAVLIFGTIFGSWRSLESQRRQVTEQFYSGPEGDGYSIASNLDRRMEYASNLVKIAGRYDAAAASEAVTAAVTALQNAQTPAEKYDANLALTDAVGTLDQQLQTLGLSEEDEGYRKSLTTDFASYQMKIDKQSADYNAAARRFNQEILGGFPARLFGAMTGVEKVETFA